MTTRYWRFSTLAFSLTLALSNTAQAAEIVHPDHYEFDATLSASLAPVAGRYPITLFFDYPSADRKSVV